MDLPDPPRDRRFYPVPIQGIGGGMVAARVFRPERGYIQNIVIFLRQDREQIGFPATLLFPELANGIKHFYFVHAVRFIVSRVHNGASPLDIMIKALGIKQEILCIGSCHIPES